MLTGFKQSAQIVFFKALFFLSLSFFSLSASSVLAATSVLKLKTGISNLSLTSGDRLKNTPLKSMINLTPTVLWDFQSFSSRFGVHYLMELSSPYGLTPMTGIGLSAYYHIFGITTGFEYTKDEVLIQKSRPGPYIYLGITPVNLNVNRFDTEDPAADNFYFSAYVNDISVGLGYDYPFTNNMTFSTEFTIRNGRTVESSHESVEFTGWTLYFALATAYF